MDMDAAWFNGYVIVLRVACEEAGLGSEHAGFVLKLVGCPHAQGPILSNLASLSPLSPPFSLSETLALLLFV